MDGKLRLREGGNLSQVIEQSGTEMKGYGAWSFRNLEVGGFEEGEGSGVQVERKAYLLHSCFG